VSRLELVELIEGEVSKLSARGRDLWERLELHVETEAPEEATPATLPPPNPEQVEVSRLMGELPLREQGILERLMELLAGLHSSDYAERHGQPGEPGRDEACSQRPASRTTIWGDGSTPTGPQSRRWHGSEN
jgi:hypothetical protein